MIAFCWIFSFSLLIPTLFGTWGEFGYRAQSFSCTILRKGGRSPKKFLFILGFLLPCLIIVISYSCIFYRVSNCFYLHFIWKNIYILLLLYSKTRNFRCKIIGIKLSCILTRHKISTVCCFLILTNV